MAPEFAWRNGSRERTEIALSGRLVVGAGLPSWVISSPDSLLTHESVVGGKADENVMKADVRAVEAHNERMGGYGKAPQQP